MEKIFFSSPISIKIERTRLIYSWKIQNFRKTNNFVFSRCFITINIYSSAKIHKLIDVSSSFKFTRAKNNISCSNIYDFFLVCTTGNFYFTIALDHYLFDTRLSCAFQNGYFRNENKYITVQQPEPTKRLIKIKLNT